MFESYSRSSIALDIVDNLQSKSQGDKKNVPVLYTSIFVSFEGIGKDAWPDRVYICTIYSENFSPVQKT